MRKTSFSTSLSKIAAALLTATLASAAVAYDSGGSSWGGSYSGTGNCASGDGTSRAQSLQAVGLTSDQRLICFNEFDPANARTIGRVSGLFTDTSLIGIDFRVQDNKLYGVGNAGGVYTLDTTNGAATLVNRLSVALSGTSFGVDFNPAADRLRIVSDTGQNLRHNVNAGGATVTDAPLNYAPGTPLNSIGPTAMGIVGSAYTNNDLSPLTATTLYAFDSTLDQIAIQSPPNNGSLAATGKLTVDAGPNAGFDIYSTVRDGVTVDVQSLAVFTTAADGRNGLYSIKLPTGKATLRGSFGASNSVVDIAIPLNQL